LSKVNVAFYWMASCGGCEEAQVDAITDDFSVLNVLNVVFWPVALDFKREDVERMPDKSIDIALINGGVRLSEHVEMAKLLRRKAKIVIAYGACSSWGGVPGLGNLYTREDIFSRVYSEVPTLKERGVRPQPKYVTEEGIELELPEVLPLLLPLNAIIEVDYYIPGCPPTPETTLNAIKALLEGKLPPKGSVLGASSRTLCEECPLNKTKPDKVLVVGYRRIYNTKVDSEKCLLVQGIPCLGPLTRGGCKALCPQAAAPCVGCYGPLETHVDYGMKALSYIASILDVRPDESEVKRVLDEGIPDPVGLIYKFTLPTSRLRMSFRKKA